MKPESATDPQRGVPNSVGSKQPISTVERPNVDVERPFALQTEDGLAV